MVYSCHNTQPVSSTSEVNHSKIYETAKTQFGQNYAVIFNTDSSYGLVISRHKKIEDLFTTVNLFVYDKKTESIIFRDSLASGAVKWDSDFVIIATSRVKNEASDTQNVIKTTYYYDVRLRQKIKLVND